MRCGRPSRQWEGGVGDMERKRERRGPGRRKKTVLAWGYSLRLLRASAWDWLQRLAALRTGRLGR